MTGWRIGFLYGPPAVAAKAAALQSHQTTTYPAAPSKYAALAAYSATGAETGEYRTMLEAFERRRQLVISLSRERMPAVPDRLADSGGGLLLRGRLPGAEDCSDAFEARRRELETTR